ncbi:MAG: ribbon-helix-helix domain-containing protein [Microbacterium sp.]
MSSQTFNISLPRELVRQLDAQAQREFSSRSEYVRRAIVNQLRAEQEVTAIFDRANARGRALGISSEQQVYDIIAD